ncbi:MAG: macro domain-containing protein [Lachnospiraceae bacterium]|nr:macro domain-containing protein [Lachnospiraceae bacterium]
MAFRIVRNDITKMNTEAIVNTANDRPTVGTGCDAAVYEAAGMDELLAYRKEKIGYVPEGEVFITPGFKLPAKYIIHAVSPLYMGGGEGEEEKLRSCYQKSLQLAKEKGIRSLSFPLISTGGFGYPKEEGMRIAVDEINAFLLQNEMEIFLVVFDDKARDLGKRICPELEEYIDRNYVEEKSNEEYGAPSGPHYGAAYGAANAVPLAAAYSEPPAAPYSVPFGAPSPEAGKKKGEKAKRDHGNSLILSLRKPRAEQLEEESCEEPFLDFETGHESKLRERMQHISDTFSQYLMYLIREKNMENAEVYKRAIVDKKIFSKIKNNADYHPQKLTALCLCVGAKLNLDESKDLLARAGYALSPCDKTDIIFSYFIENGIYDMIELDIQLEEHGLPCIIS